MLKIDNIILKDEVKLNSDLEVVNHCNSNRLIIQKTICHKMSVLQNSFCSQSQSILNRNKNYTYAANFPEKIIFVLDTVSESNNNQFKSTTGITYGSLYMIKRVIEIFLHNKIMINHKHEFALVVLDSQKVHWLCDFTGDLKKLLNVLEMVEDNIINSEEKYFDMQQVFDLVYQQVIYKTSLIQNNIIRIILLYCRSNTIPKFDTRTINLQKLFKNPNFFIDVLYIHEYLNLKNKCEEIYTELTKLDVKNISYIIEVTRSAIKIHNYMARLLTHPIQRIYQKDIKYFVHPSIMELIQENKCS